MLFSFTVALRRLRLSPLYVYGIMKPAGYNDHQIWIRSFTAEEEKEEEEGGGGSLF